MSHALYEAQAWVCDLIKLHWVDLYNIVSWNLGMWSHHGSISNQAKQSLPQINCNLPQINCNSLPVE